MLDQNGQAFRYSAVKIGPRKRPGAGAASPGALRLVAVAEALHEAGIMVLHGVSGVPDDYSAYQADMAMW